MTSPGPEQQPLSLDTLLRRRDAIVSSDVDSRTYLMDAGTGKQFALEDVGARIWALLELPRTVNALKQRLVHEFAVDAAACEADLRLFLDRLLNDGLLEVVACERILPPE